ncbi:MAG: cytidylyltransferase domain-containing protein [Acidobacteriota bacterium]
MKNRLCTICARGGSKGVKNKNIRELLGKPLIAHSITHAIESGLFEAIAVSSDSSSILDVAGEWGADYLIKRPDEMATDTAYKFPAIQHCARQVEKKTGLQFETFVDLDATSPLRLAKDIRGAVDLLENRHVANVITGAPARRSPYFNMVEENSEGYIRLCKPLPELIVRRQDAPKCYDMNASIYVWGRDGLFERTSVFNDDTLIFVMPEERSIDVDSELDFAIIDFLLRKRETGE